MDYYRGRKIDKAFKEEVARNSAIIGYKNAVKIFIYRQDLEASSLCDELADNLLKLGFSWKEIEALELEAYDEREKELEKFDKEHPNWEQLINV
jgi:hypothetical protein